jgi:hypothetical protein
MSLRPEILTSLCVLLCSAFWLSWLAAGSPLNAKLSGAQNHDQPQSQLEARSRSNSNKALDACSLLTSTDIAAILGEPLHELKPSTQATGKMNMSQCVFVTQNFAKSASLAVATPGAEDSDARNLRAFWRNQFHSPRKQEEERRPASIKSPAKSAFTSPREAPESKAITSESARESDSEAEDDARKPRPISALGEEAYWVGSPLAGALYVLQGDLFLRISVGGIPKESTRIAKSKSLATAILPRLRRNPPR